MNYFVYCWFTESMFYLKNKYLLVPPSSSDYKLIFTLNHKKLRYDRSEFSDQKVDGRISRETFDKMIDEVERDLRFFRRVLVYKVIGIFTLVSLLLFLIIGIGIIIADAVNNKQRTESEFKNLTGNPDEHLIENKGNDISMLTIIGIVISTFGAVQFIVVLIVINILSIKTFQKYKIKIAKIFDNYNRNVFKNNEIKMIQGENAMWLEMRLDYKYNAYIAQRNNGQQLSWEHIAALNVENARVSEQNAQKNNLLERVWPEFWN